MKIIVDITDDVLGERLRATSRGEIAIALTLALAPKAAASGNPNADRLVRDQQVARRGPRAQIIDTGAA